MMSIFSALVIAALISQQVTGSFWNAYKKSNPEEFSGQYDGDILLPKGFGFRNAGLYARKWPNGIVPYETEEVGALLRNRIDRALRWLEDVVGRDCIRFVPRTNERNYVKVFSGSGCYSSVGMKGGAQKLSLNRLGCFEHSTIQHEFLHALGFWHEQMRQDRDKYLQINWDNIKEDMKYNFNKITTNDLNTPYYYGSIMHYGSFTFSKNLRKTMQPKNLETKIGVRRIVKENSWDAKRVRLFYGCDPPLKYCKDDYPMCKTVDRSDCIFNHEITSKCRKTCGVCILNEENVKP
ncbi:high choriolytic enzyme 1-like [Tubulanus polymorphus]|uniref:high choriolytic enzyme 1-like n=1 Tax=Tubulanus polymorphus TaxID=672921 RepID=UPI003DA5A4AF